MEVFVYRCRVIAMKIEAMHRTLREANKDPVTDLEWNL